MGNPYEQDLDRNTANYAPLTPLTFIERAAGVYPDRTSVIHGAQRYTWKETFTRCRRLASALVRRGIGAGDTVAVMLPNTPPMYEAHFGVPVTGAVIVTTPQDIALIDAKKGLKMFEKVGIPILGIVENMSTHICSNCGHEENIFGAGGAEKMGKDYGVEVLGRLPLDMAIREQTDSGKPTVVADPDGRVAEIYRSIARRGAVKIAESQKDMTGKFPNIVVQNT